ncbi:MAG: ATP-grasp domain-containing protein [Acidobacteria bacterium]|nr:ATP-grasp domain-containing protein [Acidobacteriota bacterium]MCB9397367.1 ATP-grasp domain-containing protein [Acidobacteriota bacterium]
MHVLFVEPCFPSYQGKFIDALHSVGAKITGIGEVPWESVPRAIKEKLVHYEQVQSVVHEPSLLAAVQRCQKRGWVDRLEATIEAHIMPVAKVREACGIPGTSVKTAFLCRDKPAMKQALREAGIPCAQSTGAHSPDEIRAFAQKVGFPLILKPPAGAGAAGATRVNNAAELDAAMLELGAHKGAYIAVEEFIEGHEGFYDTISIGGDVVHEFVSHYYPNVLHAMRTRWISPQIITTNRLDASGYDELKVMGRKVIKALGIGTSATHMEWFYGPKGLKFSEIGCRPPGVGAWDLYCAANDFDLYQEWAMAIVHRKPGRPPSRNYSAGMIALRPDRDGTIAAYEGLDLIQKKYGQWIIDGHFPPVGSRTAPVEGGYWANAWMRVKYPDYDGLRAIMDEIGQTIKVRAR